MMQPLLGRISKLTLGLQIVPLIHRFIKRMSVMPGGPTDLPAVCLALSKNHPLSPSKTVMRYTVIIFTFLFWSQDFKAQNLNPIAEIPFELEDHHIFIRLNIEGSKALEFIFDTGAVGTVINSALTESLDLNADKTAENTGAAGKGMIQVIKN